jgi:hypothetical protein
MAGWVPQRGEGPVLEFEQLVRVFYAEHGSKNDLLATIESVREWSEDRSIASAGIPQGYLEGTGPVPERLPWLLLVGQFLGDFNATVNRWAEWAESVVEAWPDDLTLALPDRETLETMVRDNEREIKRASERRRRLRKPAASS